jgi:thioesterase domain-containing protein
VRASASILADDQQSPPPDLGWGTLLAGEVSVVDVEGSHRTLVREPYVGNVAGALNAAFEKLESSRDA